MKVLSVNVGLPRDLNWHGREVRTSIWKSPVEGPVRLAGDNFEGDQQSDLTVHGGPNKAVYGYPHEHYATWQRELPQTALPPGAFGENLTTEGLIETDLHIGDVLRIGTAELQVTQPRMPCYKLGIRFAREDMVKRFLHSGRSGFYFRVVKAGAVSRGDSMQFLQRSEHVVTVANLAALYTQSTHDEAVLRRALKEPALPDFWREEIGQYLSDLSGDRESSQR